MAGVIDYGRFAERLRKADTTAGRWELLRAFQHEWGYRPPGGEPRWTKGVEDGHRAGMRDLYDVDRFSGVDPELPVPGALDEWWDLPFNSFTYRPRLYWTNPVYPPEVRPALDGASDMEGLPEDSPLVGPGGDRRVCVFKTEYQCCNEWGYPAALADQHDPPVLVSVEDERWELQARSISEFFLALAVERLPARFGWTMWLGRIEEEQAARLRAAYPELGLLPWRELMANSTAYGAHDAIVHHDVDGHVDYELSIRARTREALLNVARTLGVDDPERYAIPPEVPGPVDLAEGDTDERGRWRLVAVEPVADEPPPPAGLPGRCTAWATDGSTDGATVVAGDRLGHLHAGEHRERAHRTEVTAVDCLRAPDGRHLVVSGDAGGTVRVGALPAALGGHELDRRSAAVTAVSLALPESGPALAAAWSDGVVQMRDLASGSVAELPLGSGIARLDLRADGTLRVTDAERTAVLALDLDRMWPHRELRTLLNEVDWDGLTVDRGTVDEVPELLVGVFSDDEDTAVYSARRLSAWIHAEGEAYSAAPPAVPFLLDAAADPANLARPHVFRLLGDLARVPEHRDLLAAEAPFLLGLLERPDTRAGAGYVLAAFPEHVPAVAAKARQTRDPGLVLAAGDTGDARALLASERRDLRAAAALVLLAEDPPAEVGAILAEEAAAPDSFLDGTPWTAVTERAALLDELIDRDPELRVRLARAALRTPDAEAIEQAGEVLRTWRAAPPVLLPALADLLTDPEHREAALAEIATGVPYAAAVADALVPLLAGPHAGIALEVLAAVGDVRALPRLTADLSDPRLNYDLSVALNGMADHAAALAPALRTVFTGGPRYRITKAVTGIRSWGDRLAPLLPDLLDLLDRRESAPAVALTLAELGERAADAVPFLHAQLGVKSARKNAAWALWRITGDAADALPVLLPTFESGLSVTALERLLALGEAAAPLVPHLRELREQGRTPDTLACALYRLTGDPALLADVAGAVAATPLGALAIRCLPAEPPPQARSRLETITGSPRVLAEDLATDHALRALAAAALERGR